MSCSDIGFSMPAYNTDSQFDSVNNNGLSMESNKTDCTTTNVFVSALSRLFESCT